MWASLAIVLLGADPQFGLTTGAVDSGAPRVQRPPPAPRPRPPEPGNVCATPFVADRTCRDDSECVVVSRMTDCCGSRSITAISRADLPRYEERQQLCPPEGRTCGCAAGPTRLDDGSRLGRGDTAVAVCREQVCTSTLAPRPAPPVGPRVP